jgi:hypothetical protein
MRGTKKIAVAGVWALTIAAAFAIGRSSAPGGSATELAPEDLATAIRAALGEPDVLDRAERTTQLLEQLGPANIAEVVEVYDGLLNILGELSIRPFIAAWARFDPEAALRHTLRWPFKDKAQMGAQTAIGAWALRDPDAALAAYERLVQRRSELESVLLFDLLTGWLYSGKGGVDDYVAKLPSGTLDTAVSRIAAKTLRRGGIDATIAWVDSVTANPNYDAKFKKKAFQRGTRMVARLDPDRAAAWVFENRAQDFAFDGPRIIAEQWGAKDGRAALEWVRSYPDETARHQAGREAFRTWYISDPDGAVAWLESETITQFHEPMIVYLAKELGFRTPDRAIGWCEKLLDEQRRLRCLEKAAAQWYRRDAVAAETWLQQSPLDEEARREVRAPAEKRRPTRRAPAGMRPQANAQEQS